MTRQEFDLIKEVINECLKKGDIRPAVRLVMICNRHKLINDRTMDSLFNYIRNRIYVTCSMYYELKKLEKKDE